MDICSGTGTSQRAETRAPAALIHSVLVMPISRAEEIPPRARRSGASLGGELNRGIHASQQMTRRDALPQRRLIDVINDPREVAEKLLHADHSNAKRGVTDAKGMSTESNAS